MAPMTRHEAELIWARVEERQRFVEEQARRAEEAMWRYLLRR